MSATRLRCAKTAKLFEVLFGMVTLGDPRHIVLDKGPDPLTARGFDAAFAKLLWPLVLH